MATSKKAEPVEPMVMWWDRGMAHPLDDAQFVQAFCAFVLTTSDDHSLRIVRNRAYRFIRNFMHPELEQQLSKYRAVHP